MLSHISDNYGKIARVIDPYILVGHDALRHTDKVLYERFHTVYCLEEVWAISIDANIIKECQSNKSLVKYIQAGNNMVEIFPSFGYNIEDNLANLIHN